MCVYTSGMSAGYATSAAEAAAIQVQFDATTAYIYMYICIFAKYIYISKACMYMCAGIFTSM